MNILSINYIKFHKLSQQQLLKSKILQIYKIICLPLQRMYVNAAPSGKALRIINT